MIEKSKQDKKKIAILSALRDEAEPVSSARLVHLLENAGLIMSERSVRLYLRELDEEGFTEAHGKRGRTITETGVTELRSREIGKRVGTLSAKIDQMTYLMDFDLPTRSGDVVVNTSFVDPGCLLKHVDEVSQVFAKGYAMGTRVGLLPEGQEIGNEIVPQGMIGFCTVCSITLNGVMLKHGIPAVSRFGGVLETREGKAAHFIEMIHYDGTTIDPLEVFIRSGMTDYRNAIASGNGRIGASFREFPAASRELVILLSRQLSDIGLGAFMEIGLPGQTLLDIPVSEGRFGAIVIGGLNPISILEEHGTRISSRALSGLMEYNRLFSFEELPRRIREISRK